MHKKLLKQLVALSYSDDSLDKAVVLEIAEKLSRKELKLYINALKKEEQARRVVVALPKKDEQMFQKLQDLFPKKRMEVEEDPSLILGMKITDNDMVYNFTLQNTLKNIVKYVDEAND